MRSRSLFFAVHIEFFDSPKVGVAAHLLGVHPWVMESVILRLWRFAMMKSPSGHLTQTPLEIAVATKWTMAAPHIPAEVFIARLVESRWLDRMQDGSVAVHEWDLYAGRLLAARAKHAASQGRSRERKEKKRAYDREHSAKKRLAKLGANKVVALFPPAVK